VESNSEMYKARVHQLEVTLASMGDERFGNWLRTNFFNGFHYKVGGSFTVPSLAGVGDDMSYEFSSYGHIVLEHIIRILKVRRVMPTEVVVDVGKAPVDILGATMKFAMALGAYAKEFSPEPDAWDVNSCKDSMMINTAWIDWYRANHYTDFQVAWGECAKRVYIHHYSNNPDAGNVTLMPDPDYHRRILVFPILTEKSFRP